MGITSLRRHKAARDVVYEAGELTTVAGLTPAPAEETADDETEPEQGSDSDEEPAPQLTGGTNGRRQPRKRKNAPAANR